MARYGNKRKVKYHNNKNNKNKEYRQRRKPVEFTLINHHSSRRVLEHAYYQTFWSEGCEWRGLEREEPRQTGTETEMWYYLSELENVELYEQTFHQMLKKLKQDEKIDWWELKRQQVEWHNEEEMLVLRVR